MDTVQALYFSSSINCLLPVLHTTARGIHGYIVAGVVLVGASGQTHNAAAVQSADHNYIVS